MRYLRLAASACASELFIRLDDPPEGFAREGARAAELA